MFRNAVKTAASAVLALTLGGGAVVYALVIHTAPALTDIGGYTVNLSAEYSGLGNKDIIGRVVFNGIVQYTCQNNGGNTAPGQPLPVTNPQEVSVGAETKNGRAVLDFDATFTPPATLPGRQAGCPSGKWLAINPDILGPVSATGTILYSNQQQFSQTLNNISD